MGIQPRMTEPEAFDTGALDDVTRAEYREQLRQHLLDPVLRAVEGFPIGSDEAILEVSDPPFYTACPNPFVKEIVEQWIAERTELRTRIGLAGDEAYHREPFAADVSEGKSDPIYIAHSYHTKVPYRAIMRYILHYTEPGDIVFDGFCGTGMTGVAAQQCGRWEAVEALGFRVDGAGTIYAGAEPVSRVGTRRGVLVDLSPAATFIASRYNTPIDSSGFMRQVERIQEEAEHACGWAYVTLHQPTDHQVNLAVSNLAASPAEVAGDGELPWGRINYTVWSDAFTCPTCGGEVVFWDAAVDKAAGKVRDEFPCGQCQARLTKRTLDRAWETQLDYATGTPTRQPRGCYGLWATAVTRRCSIRQTKARTCRPATTFGKRS